MKPKSHFLPGSAARLAAYLLIAPVGLLCSSFAAMAQDQPATLVAVDKILSEPLSQTVPVIGRLVARRTGEVASRTGGAVAEIRVDVGDRVEKDQVVATLVKDPLQWQRNLRAAEVTQAQAALKTSRARVGQLKQELKRLEDLRKSAAFSQARRDDKRLEVVTAESEVAESDAALKRTRANLKLAEIDLFNADIRSPYAGVITNRLTESGAYVKAGDSVITLIDDTSLEIEADVPAQRVGGLAQGTGVTFRFTGGAEMPAEVRAVVPEENPLTRTRTVRFTATFNDGITNLAASQSVTLNLPAGAARNVVTVHKDAILNRKGRTLVFVVEDGTARIRPVILAEAVGSRFEVVQGLKSGEVVVVRGNERLRPNQKVRYRGGS